MSAAAIPIPIQRAANVVEAMASDIPVVVHCLACARSKKLDPYLIAAKLGAVPFGLIVGALPCKGCGEKVAAVFPWYAPNPREWAKISKPVPETKKQDEGFVHVDGKFAYGIQMWNSKHSDIVRTLALIDNLNMGHAAFEVARKQYPKDDLTMSQGAHLLGDTRRPDIKPVK